MKRLRNSLSILLAIMIVASLLGLSSAEDTKEKPWQPDILALMDEGNMQEACALAEVYAGEP